MLDALPTEALTNLYDKISTANRISAATAVFINDHRVRPHDEYTSRFTAVHSSVALANVSLVAQEAILATELATRGVDVKSLNTFAAHWHDVDESCDTPDGE